MTIDREIHELLADIRRYQSDPTRNMELRNSLWSLTSLTEKAASTLEEMSRQIVWTNKSDEPVNTNSPTKTKRWLK